MVVPLQLMVAGVVCSSWYYVGYVPFLEVVSFLMRACQILYQITLQ